MKSGTVLMALVVQDDGTHGWRKLSNGITVGETIRAANALLEIAYTQEMGPSVTPVEEAVSEET